MGTLFKQMSKNSESVVDRTERWATGLTGIVAENNDPENQHRVKVIIPSIDENETYDEWVRQFVFCLGDGFGSVFIPPVGSEVVLFGTLGEKYNLFYASVYNEEMKISSQLSKDIAGIHAPKSLYFIAAEFLKNLAQNILIKAEQLVNIIGENIKSEASQLNELKGSQVKIDGNQISLSGSTITMNSDGSVTISANGQVSISGGSVKIENRLVKKIGPPI
jgi:Type VI secretion system/phage-baseplate injector OB domain